jgi:spore photoproduct lyase
MERAIEILENKNNAKNIKGESVRYRSGISQPSIKLKSIKRLDGSIDTTVDGIADGSIIKLFDKTSFPKEGRDVVCPHFLELKWANGCRFDCAWCYLNGTFRFRPNGKEPYLKNKEKIIEHIETFLRDVSQPSILNSGELSDSLVFEGSDFSLAKNIIPLFKNQQKHKLLILTKSVNIKDLLNSNSQEQVITSFSLNAYPVAERWEKKAPHPKYRIKAAKKLYDAGYEVRIRIDPMVPVDGWEMLYKELIDDIFKNLVPERITMGSLRGLQSTINNGRDTSWVKFLSERSNWGKKVDSKLRHTIYFAMINYLKNEYGYDNIALCKETVDIWEKLGLDHKVIRCNCVW